MMARHRVSEVFGILLLNEQVSGCKFLQMASFVLLQENNVEEKKKSKIDLVEENSFG